jgi:hypothetical protein
MTIRTKHGRVITDADLDRMADEAEAGYDLSTWKPRRGRPSLDLAGAGAHSPRIATRIPEGLRSDLERCAIAEGKSVSQVIRGLIEDYVQQRTREAAQHS